MKDLNTGECFEILRFAQNDNDGKVQNDYDEKFRESGGCKQRG